MRIKILLDLIQKSRDGRKNAIAFSSSPRGEKASCSDRPAARVFPAPAPAIIGAIATGGVRVELALLFASFLFFSLGFPAPELFVRCGLSASLRFSPRAALALSGVAALSGAGAALAARGGLRAVPAPARDTLLPASFAGGTLGRSLLLMFTSIDHGSLPLLRLQVVPLLLLCLLCLLPARAARRAGGPGTLRAACLLCGAVDGFFGAGGALLLGGLQPPSIERRRFAPASLPLLLTVCAQGAALLLTVCCGAAQVFPARMVLLLAAGSALGALTAEQRAGGGALFSHLRAGLRAYLLLAALAGVEQAYL